MEFMIAQAVVQTKSSGYRIFLDRKRTVWIVYYLCSQAYSLILAHSLSIISCITAIIRLDIKKEE